MQSPGNKGKPQTLKEKNTPDCISREKTFIHTNNKDDEKATFSQNTLHSSSISLFPTPPKMILSG
jgi:hypothetical protein